MKSFKLILAILLVSFLIDKLVYLSLNVISDNVFAGQGIGKLNQYLALKDTTKVLIYGSSRANHSLDPKHIKKTAYNMGVDGKTINYAKTLIKILSSENKQLIVLQIDPSRVIENEYIGDDIKQLKPKYHRNSIISSEIDKLNLQNPLQDFYWSLDYNGNVLPILKNYFFPKYNHSSYNGYDPIFVDPNQKKTLLKILSLSNNDNECTEQSLNTIFTTAILDIIDFAHKNNKELLIYTSPEYSDFCKKDNDLLNVFLLKNKVQYYDFSDFFKEDNNLDYWKDRVHLTDKGAQIFSTYFSDIINKKGQ